MFVPVTSVQNLCCSNKEVYISVPVRAVYILCWNNKELERSVPMTAVSILYCNKKEDEKSVQVPAVQILCCSNKEVEMSVSVAAVQNTRCGYVYNIFLHQVSDAKPQTVIILCHQTKCKRKYLYGCHVIILHFMKIITLVSYIIFSTDHCYVPF